MSWKASVISTKRLMAALTMICLLLMYTAVSEETEIADVVEDEESIEEIELDAEGEIEESVPEDVVLLGLQESLLVIDEAVVNDAVFTASNDNEVPVVEVEISDYFFPDDAFRAYISEEIDLNKDGFLSTGEIEAVTSIDVNERGISSLEGIEIFSNLVSLECEENDIRNLSGNALDVSNNTKLVSLNCSSNKLGYLDVSGNIRLKYLDCSGCGLRTLDVSSNLALEELYCSDNRVTYDEHGEETENYQGLSVLNVSKNTQLRTLVCGWNLLKTLNVKNNRRLTDLSCPSNNLSALDVSRNSKLQYLECALNDIAVIDITNCSKLIPYVNRKNLVNEGDGYCDFLNEDRQTVVSIPNGCCVTVNGKVIFGAAVWQLLSEEIRFGSYSISIGCGEEYSLVDKRYADCATYYTFRSSKPKTVAVSPRGVVTGKKEGKAKINVSGGDNYYDGPEEPEICKITVKKAPVRITLSEKAITLETGEYKAISWKLPSGSASAQISFSSSNKTVCKVVNDPWMGYVVEAYRPGSATVTVKTYNGKTATCKVTVIDPTIPTKVKLNKSGTVKLKKGKTLQLKATVSPSTAQTTLTWKSGNKKVATVTQDGLVEAKKKGTATITVKTKNGKTARVKIKVI